MDPKVGKKRTRDQASTVGSASTEADQAELQHRRKRQKRDNDHDDNDNHEKNVDIKYTVGGTGGGVAGGGAIAAVCKELSLSALAAVSKASLAALGGAVLAAGVMIGVGVSQIKSNERLIVECQDRMKNLEINLEEINKALINNNGETQLTRDIDKAFYKCFRRNNELKANLEAQLKVFRDEYMEDYNNSAFKYQQEANNPDVKVLPEEMKQKFLGAFRANLRSKQDLVLQQIEIMARTVEDIRNEYKILNKIFEVKLAELVDLQERVEKNAERTRKMGFFMQLAGIVGFACCFIPGINIVTGIAAGVVMVAGTTMNALLQVNANKLDEVGKEIKQKGDQFKKTSDSIIKIMSDLDQICKDLREFKSDLETKFEQDGTNFKPVDESQIEFIRTKAKRAQDLSTKLFDDMNESSYAFKA